MEAISIEQIKKQYPDHWVLVGNPELDDPNTLGTIVSKLVRGVVILASKDRREIGYQGREARKGFRSVTCIFTGEMPKKRKWLL